MEIREDMVVEEEVSEGEVETENTAPVAPTPAAAPLPPLQDHPAAVHQPDESLNEQRYYLNYLSLLLPLQHLQYKIYTFQSS